MMSDAQSTHRLNLSAARASLGVAAALIVTKLWAFWMTGSLAVAASAADSALDLIMSGGAMIAVSYANRPPDEDHAFGHTSVEDLTAFLQSIFLIIAAIGLVASAVNRLAQGAAPTLGAEGVGIAAMGISIVLTLGLVLWQGYVAAKTGNRVIAADRLHYMADLIPAIGSILALGASWAWGIWQLDSVVALLAAAVLAKGAWEIGTGAWHALMDRRADPEIVAGIAAIADRWPGVLGWHDLKTRTAGSRIFAHLHIELDGDQTLREAHEIGATLRRAILQAYPQIDIIIHKDIANET